MTHSRKPGLRAGLSFFIATTLLAACSVQVDETTNSEATNKIGITMVDIPAGSFVMGSCLPPNDKDRFMGRQAACTGVDRDTQNDEAPQHRVSLRAFQMGKTEVTLGQFKQFIAAANREDLLDDDFMKYNAHGDDAPVVMVSWHDAQAFIAWLNKTDGKGWRLPSEAEWEYACRAGGQHKYCGGDNSPNALDWSNALDWFKDHSNRHQYAVASKQPNAWGLFDMSGNVWEWVQDCWHKNYNGAPTDGSAWTGGCDSDGRGLRGGAWGDGIMGTRAASRIGYLPGDRLSIYGFRLARTR